MSQSNHEYKSGIFPFGNQPKYEQDKYIKPNTIGTADEFGWSIALDDNTLVVGAPQEKSNTVGVNGNETDNSSPSPYISYNR